MSGVAGGREGATAEHPDGAAAASTSQTVTLDPERDPEGQENKIPEGATGGATAPTLRLSKKEKKAVKWRSDTVDNEGLGKKKSKCCCIYIKPKVFGQGGDSSSGDESDEDDCKHCPGHHGKDLKPERRQDDAQA